MEKGLLRQEKVQTTKKDQYNRQSTDDEKLKAKAAPSKTSITFLLSKSIKNHM